MLGNVIEYLISILRICRWSVNCNADAKLFLDTLYNITSNKVCTRKATSFHAQKSFIKLFPVFIAVYTVICFLEHIKADLRFHITPFAVHLRKIYIHLRQQLKLHGKYTFISTSMNFINANELSITLLAYVLIFNSIHGWTIAPLDNY